ncbi:MAG TPA: DMT family transporter [Saprospiraceae bacterium]|nr:DMT family transporter [Saprospiraceae bacterium]
MIIKSKLYGAVLGLIGAILFAGKAIIIKWIYLNHEIKTLPLLTLRMLFSMPFYIYILLKVERDSPMKLQNKEKISLLSVGLLGYYLASFLDFKGLEYISATLERLILFIYPTLVLVISAIFFKRKITKVQAIAVLLTYIGIVIAFVPDMKMQYQNDILLGTFFIFLSALCYALYLIGSGELVKKLGTQRMTSYALIVSCIAVIIHFIIADGSSLLKYDQEIYLLCFIMAVFSTVIPSFLVAESIKRIGASSVSILSTIGPIATILMATQILEEVFTNWHMIGTFFIIGGVLFISLQKEEKNSNQ